VGDEPESSDSSNIPIGYVRKAHGIRGDVLVRGLVSDADARFMDGATVRTGDVEPRSFAIHTVSPHKGDFIISLAGVETRNDAEALVGVQFVITAGERRSLDDGEWWAEDLIGCVVVDVEGDEIGVVADVISGSAQDRLAVRTPDGAMGEVPFVDALVPHVDVVTRRIVVDVPDGLFA
jgi:16S rRNA processing protein RimM